MTDKFDINSWIMLIFAIFLIIFRKFCGLRLVIYKIDGASEYIDNIIFVINLEVNHIIIDCLHCKCKLYRIHYTVYSIHYTMYFMCIVYGAYWYMDIRFYHISNIITCLSLILTHAGSEDFARSKIITRQTRDASLWSLVCHYTLHTLKK